MKTILQNLFVTIIILLFITYVHATTPCAKTIIETLEQTATILNQKSSIDLWGKQLNADIIMVDYKTNNIYI